MMTRNRVLWCVLFAALSAFAVPAARGSAEVPPEVRARAAGIFAALDRIEADAARPRSSQTVPASPAPGSRHLTFSEAELNAYAACRVDVEGRPYIKAAEFKLLAGDRIEGRISIDLGKPQASGLMAQKQDLLFAARVETKDGKIRINMDKLFLGAQAVSPDFVDVIISIVSRLQGVEPTSLKDWYDLPEGVLRLESLPGQVVVIY
jgi:hypothetical protein